MSQGNIPPVAINADRSDTAPNPRRGRALAQMRREGFEVVDEERLVTVFQDLANEDEDGDRIIIQDERDARALARRAMEILRG